MDEMTRARFEEEEQEWLARAREAEQEERELGHQMKMGIEAAFNMANTSGGVNGRQLRLVAVDDGYEPARTAETMKQLNEQDRVFGIVGSVGSGLHVDNQLELDRCLRHLFLLLAR
jgi:substrate-binding family protein